MRNIGILKRQSGKTLAMVILLKKRLEDNETPYLLTQKKNVDRILKMLGDYGIKATAEPTYVTPNMKLVWGERGTFWVQPPKRQTGFKIIRT